MTRWISGAIVLALTLSACTSAGPEEAAPTPDGPGAGILAAAEEEEFVRREAVGVLVNRFDLRTGQCFSVYDVVDDSGVLVEEVRQVECQLPHDAEVYIDVLVPGIQGTPYPGDGFLDQWAQTRCYEEFLPFVGKDYELSKLEIGWVRPNFTTWNGPGVHRGVICFLESFEDGQLIGSMQGTGI